MIPYLLACTSMLLARFNSDAFVSCFIVTLFMLPICFSSLIIFIVYLVSVKILKSASAIAFLVFVLKVFLSFVVVGFLLLVLLLNPLWYCRNRLFVCCILLLGLLHLLFGVGILRSNRICLLVVLLFLYLHRIQILLRWLGCTLFPKSIPP